MLDVIRNYYGRERRRSKPKIVTLQTLIRKSDPRHIRNQPAEIDAGEDLHEHCDWSSEYDVTVDDAIEDLRGHCD